LFSVGIQYPDAAQRKYDVSTLTQSFWYFNLKQSYFMLQYWPGGKRFTGRRRTLQSSAKCHREPSPDGVKSLETVFFLGELM